jgi:phenylalanyl-tRNA synthetase alpha chain
MRLEEVKTNFFSEITTTDGLLALENIHLKYFGRKGIFNDLFSEMKNLSDEEKKSFGAKINLLKIELEEHYQNSKNELLNKDNISSKIDLSLPLIKKPHGSLHVVSYAIEEISSIFEKLGFVRVSYPEVEWEYFAFEALNMPKNHPARDDFETFFADQKPDEKMGKLVLTPHTSNGQVREMLRKKVPPIKMINIGKTYRPNWDVTHVPMFHQFEGVCIDKNINLTHLKGTIEYFAHNFFGVDRKVRLRPYHFQFTEPSFELDISCNICGGSGEINGEKCKVCKSGWLELGGAGMIHPNVLRAGGIDPEIYSGWALGFGIERNFMMKEGLKLDDLRIMYGNDIRFLEQF